MDIIKGILIVFEGIDGSGKSTQAHMLLEDLKTEGYKTVYFREPSDSQWGTEIRKKAETADSLTPKEEFDLFQKDREENVEKNLKPALASNKVVVLDRYYFSTMAYQGAKGVDLDLIKKTNNKFVVQPELVFFLDIEPKIGLERIKDRNIKHSLFEREEYLVKVREIFLSLKGENFFHINASRPVEEINCEIKEITFKFLKRYHS